MPEPITATPASSISPGSISPGSISPDYEKLIRFLVQPFLESPEALRLDCERSQDQSRVWIRLAFEGSDKGRVFGRGGRNIQAIRAVLEAISKMAGCTVHLDVYGGPPGGAGNEGNERDGGERSHPRRPSGHSRGPSKPRR